MQKMDWYYWLPIVLGGVVGLIASIFGNLITPQVSGYLQKRKAAHIEDTKRKAMETYVILRQMHDGKRDKHAFYLLQVIQIIGSIIASAVAMLNGVLIGIVSVLKPDVAQIPLDVAQFVFGVFTAMFLYRFYSRSKRLVEWNWRLDNFAEYESQLKEQYGELLTTDSD